MQGTTPNLRPLGFGDVFDVVFRLYRNNFLTFVGVAALAQIPLLVFQLALEVGLGQRFAADLVTLTNQLPFFDPSTDQITDLPVGSILTYFAVSLLITLFQVVIVQQLVNGALANAISRRYFYQPVSMFSAYNFSLGQVVGLIVAGLLVTLIGIATGVVLFGAYFFGLILVFTAFASNSGGAVVVILGVLAFIFLVLVFIAALVALLAFVLRFLFAPQAVVLENNGPLQALGRSWQLTRGSFWRVFGIYALLVILVWIITAVPVGIASFALNTTLGSPTDLSQNYTLIQTLTLLISYAGQMLVLPVQLSTLTVLYYDLRVRKEGLDLQLRAQDTSMMPSMQ